MMDSAAIGGQIQSVKEKSVGLRMYIHYMKLTKSLVSDKPMMVEDKPLQDGLNH